MNAPGSPLPVTIDTLREITVGDYLLCSPRVYSDIQDNLPVKCLVLKKSRNSMTIMYGSDVDEIVVKSHNSSTDIIQEPIINFQNKAQGIYAYSWMRK